MLVALSIKNFKSIREAHVRFGPFTCFIGHNGVGKSNLFDAIHFLSALTERNISDAVVEVRRTSDGGYSPLDLVFGRDPGRRIELSANMVVPPVVADDFGESAKPSTTLLTYTVGLRYAPESDRLLVKHERLTHAKLGDSKSFIGFRCSRDFKKTVASGGRWGGPLISDYPTVLAAKREMASWRILHLEPSAMRTPDTRSAPPHVSASGGHIPATLHALVRRDPNARAEILNRLRQLDSDVGELDVYADDVRDQFALRARVRGVDNWLYGRSLSDGMLRYIALVLMLVDVQDRAVLCIEEPENGIHPSRVPNLAELLRDYAVDVHHAVGADNPLRQVVLNSHSPEVARQFSCDDLIFVERALTSTDGPISVFRPIADTWRTTLANGAESGVLPADRQAVADFIGGSPVSSEFSQLNLELGSAT